jgi:hypothetical protein
MGLRVDRAACMHCPFFHPPQVLAEEFGYLINLEEEGDDVWASPTSCAATCRDQAPSQIQPHQHTPVAAHAMSMLSIHAIIDSCIPWPASVSPKQPAEEEEESLRLSGSPTPGQLPSTHLEFPDEPEQLAHDLKAADLARDDGPAGVPPHKLLVPVVTVPLPTAARARPATSASARGVYWADKRRGGQGRTQFHVKAQVPGPKVVHY